MNEQLFIKKLRENFNANGAGLTVGIGDDAAILKGRLLVSCDVQVEDVHFKRNGITPEKLGQKAVAVALSDIAAMGGIPQALLLSLGIPQKTDQAFLDSLFKGVGKACKRYKIDLVGGNLSQSSRLFIDCFVLGKATIKPVTRNGAKPGDRVLVTGMLGNATFPIARIAEGNIIAESKKATAMIDISDGLSTDLLRICDASGVGVRIYTNKLPISNTSREGRSLNRGLRTTQNKDRPYQLALNGGEDYELCFTIRPKHVNSLIKKVKKETGTNITVIGEILRKEEGRWLVDEKGRKRKLESRGWDHFRKTRSTKHEIRNSSTSSPQANCLP